jgi:twitching motility protein PilT
MSGLDPALHAYMEASVSNGASDLHLTVGRPPIIRLDGELVELQPVEPLQPADIQRMVRSTLSDQQWDDLHRDSQLDYSYGVPGIARFRCNAYHQRGSLALALRTVPTKVRTLEELGAPPVCMNLLRKPYGLVLCVGPTGSGKSTTLAAMIDRINEERSCHILTIEDPIEFLHSHKRALVNQREVGSDVNSFEDGLRAALREDPDVILLGEMRDLESISITLTLAETGHLVFGTLHTNDASQALDRIIDVFPAERRDQIQMQLAGSLQGVISQRLLPKIGGGRVAGYEVLTGNEAVRNLVREGKSRQLRNVISTGAQEGMQTIEMDLGRLVATGQISMETAQASSMFPKEVLAQTASYQQRLAMAGAR